MTVLSAKIMYEMILKLSAYLILGDMADICPEMDMAVDVFLPFLQEKALQFVNKTEEEIEDIFYEIFS